MQEKQWLTVEDIAKELSFDVGTVRYWIRTKKLKAARFGKEYRIKREDYEQFIKEHMTDEGDGEEK